MTGETLYVVNRYFYTPSDGEGACLKLFVDYEDALEFVKGYEDWCEEFCDPANDMWGTEEVEIHIEEMTVE